MFRTTKQSDLTTHYAVWNMLATSPCDQRTEWELWLMAATQHLEKKKIRTHIAGLGEDPNVKVVA